MEALVIGATRKSITVLIGDQPHPAIHSTRKSELVVGDHVILRQEQGGLFVTEVLPRTNLLYRSYQNRSKSLASNLDRLFVVTACGVLFNTATIDRALVAAECADISTAIIVNKFDLATKPDKDRIDVYRACGYDVITTNAKDIASLAQLKSLLADAHLCHCAFSGISGVGKSTLLNALIPSAQLKTAAVSDRSGQGTQTTSLARGFVYKRGAIPDGVLFDLPGVQFFGVSHLKAHEIANAYPEFRSRAQGCKFADCKHRLEPECRVLAALELGEIAQFRYQSYLSMLDEVAKVQTY